MYNENDRYSMEQIENKEEIIMENEEEKKVRRKRRNKRKAGAAVILALALVIGSGAGILYENISDKNSERNEKNRVTVQQALSQTAASEETGIEELGNSDGKIATVKTGDGTEALDISDIAENVMPSIVAINSTTIEEVSGNYTFPFYGETGQGASNTQEVNSSGSGIIIGESDTELLIATNYHVVEGASKIAVKFINDTAVEGSLKGYDSDADLAVVSIPLDQIDDDTKGQIRIAVMGDSDSLKAGSGVIAIGNALGYGQSVTSGIVSALNREVQLTDKTMTLLQTDAAINPGNSGGALLNANGEVIGINTVKYASTGVEGMGYAIPINDAVPIINELMNQDSSTSENSGYLGIYGQEISEQYQQIYGMPAGIYVVSVEENSPASLAGIQSGSILTEADGKTLSSMEDLTEVMENHKSGDQIEVTYKIIQNGQYNEQTVTVTLGERQN